MNEYDTSFLLDLYKTMLTIRHSEEILVEPILTNEIKCPVHLYSGEEAVATGVCAALKSSDYVFGTHRSHGHYLAKGGSLRELFSECFCKADGCAGGRGGSMHLISPEHGMMGAAPIVAGTISLALGAALASWVREDGRIAVSFFGDGASGEGVLYETLNFASLYHLPLLLVCENNFYSTHLSIRECRPDQDICLTAVPFNSYWLKVDGNNVLAVYEAAREGVEMCRQGQGPVFLECLTYRLRGHVGPDDNILGSHTDIRPAEEVKAWKEKDPLETFANDLKSIGLVEELKKLEAEVKRQIEIDLEFARKSTFPDPQELTRYVFR